jgi:penicillin amidase
MPRRFDSLLALLSTLGIAVVQALTAPTLAAAGSDSTLALAGLDGRARIVTDRAGIVHLEAASLPDLYFAWGFATARDRLWQLEYSRRASRGRLHEWLGNRALRQDGGAQLFELTTRAERIWSRDSQDEELRSSVERYCAGINAYIDLCRTKRAPWPSELRNLGKQAESWQPQDVVAMLIVQGMVLDFLVPELDEAAELKEHKLDWLLARRRYEAAWTYPTIPDSTAARLYGRPNQRTLPGTPFPSGTRSGMRWTPSDDALAEARRVVEPWTSPDARARASNVFAVGAQRSVSGAPLLANDPHLFFRTPGPLEIVHVTVPGVVNAAGAAIPGLPVIVSGRNERVAWGLTALSADMMDLYADSLSKDRKQVKVDGRWVPLRDEPFELAYRLLGVIKIGAPGQRRLYTPRGPVLAIDKKKNLALSLKWAGHDDQITLTHMIGLERSDDAAEITERCRTIVTPGLNVVAADRDGRLLYQVVGALPRRGFDPDPGPLPGDGRHEWLGLIAPERLPSWNAPPNAVIVNANNLPIGSPFPEAFPRYDWPHDRAQRIADLLQGDRKLSLEDLAAIQSDAFSREAERFVPSLLACADSLSSELSPGERAALDTLRAWDFVARRSSTAPTVYRAWLATLERRSRLRDLPGLTLAALDGRAPEALRAPKKETPERAAVAVTAALDESIDELTKRLGKDRTQWTWQRAHVALFRHPLSYRDRKFLPPLTAIDGDADTPTAGYSNLPWQKYVIHGPIFRHLVDLSVTDSSLTIVAPGNAGEGRHRDDLRHRWADHRYVPLYLDWKRIEQVKESELALAPR